jgi:hypothetical protein
MGLPGKEQQPRMFLREPENRHAPTSQIAAPIELLLSEEAGLITGKSHLCRWLRLNRSGGRPGDRAAAIEGPIRRFRLVGIGLSRA